MGQVMTRALDQGGAFGDTADDTSYFSSGFSFTPFSYVGKHELDCYGEANTTEFDPGPITTATVTAPFTGVGWLMLPDVHLRFPQTDSCRLVCYAC